MTESGKTSYVATRVLCVTLNTKILVVYFVDANKSASVTIGMGLLLKVRQDVEMIMKNDAVKWRGGKGREGKDFGKVVIQGVRE